MNKLKFGILGCGNISRKFALALNQTECAKLVAVASRSEDKAREYSLLYKCEGIVGYNNLLDRSDIDAIYIATPIGRHMEWCIAAAKKGKHIICEKTLAINEQQVGKIINACTDSNVSLFEGFAYQFHPQHEQLSILITEGKIGKIKFFQANFGFPPINSKHRYDPSLGGGALLDAGTYIIHKARKIFNKEPIEINAYFDKDNKDIDVSGSIMLNFGDGQIAQLAFGFNNYYRNNCFVWGTEGMLELKRAFSIPDDLSTKIIYSKQDYKEEIEINPYNVFVGEIENFCKYYDNLDISRGWLSESLQHIKVIDKARLNLV